MTAKGDQIEALLKLEIPYSQIVRMVGCSKSTVSYHAGRMGLSKDRKLQHDWESIQKYYNQGRSRRECMDRFGFSETAWYIARNQGILTVIPLVAPIEPFLVARGNPIRRGTLKRRLLEEGILEYKCEACGISGWLGKKLTLQLEHKNGIYDDNRLENLCLLCPNCHSQTDTYRGKNKKYKSVRAEAP